MARIISSTNAKEIGKQALAIVDFLSEGGHTKEDAAEEFGISIRTVNSRLETFRSFRTSKYIDMYEKAMFELKKVSKKNRTKKDR